MILDTLLILDTFCVGEEGEARGGQHQAITLTHLEVVSRRSGAVLCAPGIL